MVFAIKNPHPALSVFLRNHLKKAKSETRPFYNQFIILLYLLFLEH